MVMKTRELLNEEEGGRGLLFFSNKSGTSNDNTPEEDPLLQGLSSPPINEETYLLDEEKMVQSRGLPRLQSMVSSSSSTRNLSFLDHLSKNRVSIVMIAMGYFVGLYQSSLTSSTTSLTSGTPTTWSKAPNPLKEEIVHSARSFPPLTMDLTGSVTFNLDDGNDQQQITETCLNVLYPNATLEDQMIERQVNETVDAPAFALNISTQIADLKMSDPDMTMEQILEKIQESFETEYPQVDFMANLETAFVHEPIFMEDLSNLIEDENETTGVLYLRDENQNVLSAMKEYAFTDNDLVNVTNELLAMTIIKNNTEMEEDVMKALQDSNFLSNQKAQQFSPLSIMMEKEIFLGMREDDNANDDVGDVTISSEMQEIASAFPAEMQINTVEDLAELMFKAIPNTLLHIESAFETSTTVNSDKISTFQNERLQYINETDEDAPPSFRYLRRSDEGKILPNGSTSSIPSHHMYKDDTEQPSSASSSTLSSSNTRRLLEYVNHHQVSNFSRNLRSAEMMVERQEQEVDCSSDDTSLICESKKLVATVRALDEVFCTVAERLQAVSNLMDDFDNTTEQISKVAFISSTVMTALQIGTFLPYGIGNFLKPAHTALKPVERQTIQRVNDTATEIQKKFIKPWDNTVGSVIDTLDKYTFMLNSYAPLISTYGDFVGDTSTCLPELLIKILGLGDIADFGQAALAKTVRIIQAAANEVLNALNVLVDVMKEKAWKTFENVMTTIAEVVAGIWEVFSPFELLTAIMQYEINIPWFKLPYKKRYLGPAACPSSGSWDKDTLGQNCYERCGRGFENVPHLVDWKCRPTCSSMGSYTGVGGCVNTHYGRSAYWTVWSCKSGYSRIFDASCRKDCRGGYVTHSKYCYRDNCPANFTPFLQHRYCTRNSLYRQRRSTVCYYPGQSVEKTRLGSCQVKCDQGHYDAGLLGCFPPATLTISLQDISDALQEIIDTISNLPIVKLIEDALNRLINPLLEPFMEFVDDILEELNFSWPTLPDIPNPLEGFLEALKNLKFPSLEIDIPGFDWFIDMVIRLIEKAVPEFLQDLVPCMLSLDNFSKCLDIDLPDFKSIVDPIKESIIDILSIIGDIVSTLRSCNYISTPSGEITSKILEVTGSTEQSGCQQKLPLPVCGSTEIAGLSQKFNRLYQLLGGDDLFAILHSMKVDKLESLSALEGSMLNILSIDILAPQNDIGFIESGVHRLHALRNSTGGEPSDADTYSMFSYRKLPSSKLNLYINATEGASKLPIVEYESSIQWEIFSKTGLQIRQLLEMVVASVNVLVYEEFYWDLTGWCYTLDKDDEGKPTSYSCNNRDVNCKAICDAESKLVGTGCRPTCTLNELEIILAENPDESPYWKKAENRNKMEDCAIYITDLYNNAVDAKKTWYQTTRLSSNYYSGLLFTKDLGKIAKIPLSYSSSDTEFYDGKAHYQLGVGAKKSKEIEDLRKRYGVFNGLQTLISATPGSGGFKSVSFGSVIDSFQRERFIPPKTNYPDKGRNKVGLYGQTLTFSATKTLFNLNDKPPSPAPQPTRPIPQPTPPVTQPADPFACTLKTPYDVYFTDCIPTEDISTVCKKSHRFGDLRSCGGTEQVRVRCDRRPYRELPCDSGPLEGTCGNGNWGNGCCDNGAYCSSDTGNCGWSQEYKDSMELPSHSQCMQMMRGSSA